MIFKRYFDAAIDSSAHIIIRKLLKELLNIYTRYNLHIFIKIEDNENLVNIRAYVKT